MDMSDTRHRFICTARIILLSLLVVSLPLAAADIPTEARLFMDQQGRAHLPDSSIYRGEYLDGLFHGQGELSWSNGDMYRGEFRRGLMSGRGRFEEASGSVYEGEFRAGMSHGHGVYTGLNGIHYEGQFARDVFDGQGRYTNSDGTIYEGIFHQNAPDGPGRITFKDGSHYEGEIHDWQMQGQGVYTVSEEQIYAGEFVADVLNGQGEIRQGKSIYTGQIRDWRANGAGKLILGDGSQYEGEFKNSVFDGKGRLTSKNGNIYTGNFKSGLKHGYGELVRAKPQGRKRKVSGWWEYGRYQGETRPDAKAQSVHARQREKLDAEVIYYAQPELLKNKLLALQPSRPGVTDLYMVSFGAYGQQDVFMKEARYSQALFNRRLGAEHRSLRLINNPKSINETPLASVTNLQRSLNHIASIMDKEEDILFLYLTSHGSDKHELAVSLRGLTLNDLPAPRLAAILKATGIKWKVVLISACYSGGFIKELQDDHTLVITSARPDHVSFGCSDEAEFTYFGRAYFKYALNQTVDFVSAFELASDLVKEWEDKENYDHSEPQIQSTPAIEAKLADWRKTLALPRTARLQKE
ncbi:MAG: peptidase C13 [Proteobacteria bacterium]|jgi:hypothetical protein|nr:peptidase C13 [Pseudomonadota bacterium]